MVADTPERAFLRYLERGEADAFAAFYDLTIDAVLAVAVRLTNDLARAEDLVQATYLAAIEGRARWDRTLPLVPWLVGICTNQARKLHRTSGRGALTEPERLPPQQRPTPNPHALAERQELRDALAASIAKLPDLYRPVLVLTLEHELTPAEIGRALGRPAATVRSQLFRGLDLLRGVLPPGIAPLLLGLLATRGLAAVKQAVVAQAAVVGSAIAVWPAVGGVVLMKKLFVGLSVMLLLGAAWLGLPRREASVTPAAPPPSTTALFATAAASHSPAAVPSNAGNGRARIDAVAHELASVRVTLVWARDGQPAAGVSGVLRERRRAAGRLFECPFTTDTFGQFMCGDLHPGEIDVLTDRSRHSLSLESGEHAERRLAIKAGFEVTLRVVDLDRRPIVGAEVWCSSDYDWAEGVVSGRSDERGVFVLRDFSNRRSLAVRAQGYEPAVTTQLQGQPGERLVEELVLQRGGATLRGVVRTVHGAVAATAAVQIRTHVSRQVDAVRGGFHSPPPPMEVRTDAAGMFVATGLPSGPVTVCARALDCGVAVKQVTLLVREPGWVELQLPAAVVVRGVVRDPAGAPLAQARVQARPPGQLAFASSAAVADAAGRFELEGVTCGSCEVEAGFGDKHVSRAVQVGPAMPELELIVPVATAAERIAGRVCAADGAPRVGWTVRSAPRPGLMFQTQTDAQGQFEFANCPEATTTLLVSGPDVELFAPVATVEAVARGRSDVRIIVSQEQAVFGKLTLRVLGPGGAPLARALVRVRAPNEQVFDRLTASDGRVVFAALPPGDYRLSVRMAGYGVTSLGVCTLRDASGLDLGDRQLAPAVTLRARLVGPGLSAGRAHAAIYARDGEFVAPQSPRSVATELVFEDVPPGEYFAPLAGRGIACRKIAVVVGSAAEQAVTWQVEPGQQVSLRANGCTLLAELEFTVRDAMGEEIYSFRTKCLDPDGSQVVGVALAVGAYTVRLMEAGGRLVERPLVVETVGARGLDLQLLLR